MYPQLWPAGSHGWVVVSQLKLYEEVSIKQVRERRMGQCVLAKLALGLGCPDLWLLQFS